MSKPYTKLKNCKRYCYNCVFYARSKVPSLPYGLWTLWSKKRIINSRKPSKGRVAIMDAGPWGHVGVVKFAGSKHVTIRETNYKRGKKTERHGTEKSLKILGYFKTKK